MSLWEPVLTEGAQRTSFRTFTAAVVFIAHPDPEMPRACFEHFSQTSVWVQEQHASSGPALLLLDPSRAHVKCHTKAWAHLQPRAIPNIMSSYQDTEENSALKTSSSARGYTYRGQRQARAYQRDCTHWHPSQHRALQHFEFWEGVLGLQA